MKTLKTTLLPLVGVLAFAGTLQAYLIAPKFAAAIGDDIALANADFVTQTLDQRLNNLRNGSELLDLGKPLAQTGKDGKTVQPVSLDKPWSFFLGTGYTFENLGGTALMPRSSFSVHNVLIGADKQLSDALTAGLFVNYAHTDATLDAHGSDVHVDTYGAGLYGSYHEGPWYVNGLAGYSRNISESAHNFGGEFFNGRTAASEYIVNLDGGYDHPIANGLTVGPFVGLEYVHLGVNGFPESAPGSTFYIGEQSLDSLRSRVGIRSEYRKQLNANWNTATELRVGWQHEFADNERPVAFQVSNTSRTIATDIPMRDKVLAGLGVNATYRQNLTAFADYDLQTAERFIEQIVKAGFKWSF